MIKRLTHTPRGRAALLAAVLVIATAALAAADIPNLQPFPDPTGTVATDTTNGTIDTSNPFFQSLGTNGRTCATCHVVDDALSFSAARAQALFASSGGSDPLFAFDGGNCATATPGSATDHSLILNNALIHVTIPMPANPEFKFKVVSDPYGCALVVDPASGQTQVSVYRRPLPTTNLDFLSAVMFDGRETIKPLNNPSTFAANLVTDLTHQALDATLGHAQATTAPTADQLAQIVNFELALFSAQLSDTAAGLLNTQGASGGPQALSQVPYYPGINDSLGGDPSGATFNPNVFSIFTAWATIPQSNQYTAARESVARGEALFNTVPLKITDVRGLNDALGVAQINGTCTTCHDTPNVGNHSLPVPLDIGTSHALAKENDPQIVAALGELSVPGLPVYRLSCPNVPDVYTSDPGRALITGKCADINRIKGPILRGLAARAPYFHNGGAADLTQVVNFYDQRFQIGLTDQQKADLAAFLRSL